MKTYAQKTKKWIATHKLISGVLVLVVLFAGYKLFANPNSKVESFTVKKGDIIQKVIVNGKTKAVNSVNLGFDVSGRVSKSFVDVGSRVVVGQQLVVLDSGEIYASLLKAQANLASEEVKLDELKKGTRPEEIAVSETSVANSKTALIDAQVNLKNKVINAITNDVDQLFSNPKSNTPQFNLPMTSGQLKIDIVAGRVLVEEILNNWQVGVSEINLPKIKTFLDNVASAVNRETPSSTMTQTTLDSHRANISGAISAVITAEGTLNDAKSALTLAEKNLDLKKSGSTPETIKAQEAKVLQMQADVQSINVQLNKMTLRSPQNGIVTVQEAKTGETVTSGKIIVSIISDSDLEIESNVSEISVGKVSIGNAVIITFDAFPGEVFLGTVSYIEPGETIIDGVVNYKVTIAFKEKYPQMKSGLTSKLEIITGEKKDVVVIPQYSIITKEDGSTFVSKQVGKDSVEVPVTLGLRGQDGFVEVLSGPSLGEVINTQSLE